MKKTLFTLLFAFLFLVPLTAAAQTQLTIKTSPADVTRALQEDLMVDGFRLETIDDTTFQANRPCDFTPTFHKKWSSEGMPKNATLRLTFKLTGTTTTQLQARSEVVSNFGTASETLLVLPKRYQQLLNDTVHDRLEWIKNGLEQTLSYGFTPAQIIRERSLSVLRVEPGSAADLAGLFPGDRIIYLNNRWITSYSPQELHNLIHSPAAHDTLTLIVMRGQEKIPLTLIAQNL